MNSGFNSSASLQKISPSVSRSEVAAAALVSLADVASSSSDLDSPIPVCSYSDHLHDPKPFIAFGPGFSDIESSHSSMSSSSFTVVRPRPIDPHLMSSYHTNFPPFMHTNSQSTVSFPSQPVDQHSLLTLHKYTGPVVRNPTAIYKGELTEEYEKALLRADATRDFQKKMKLERKGAKLIEIVECKGPNTIIPHGRANCERKYICQGTVIHRATFWRHRKKGCPHMQKSPYLLMTSQVPGVYSNSSLITIEGNRDYQAKSYQSGITQALNL